MRRWFLEETLTNGCFLSHTQNVALVIIGNFRKTVHLPFPVTVVIKNFRKTVQLGIVRVV